MQTHMKGYKVYALEKWSPYMHFSVICITESDLRAQIMQCRGYHSKNKELPFLLEYLLHRCRYNLVCMTGTNPCLQMIYLITFWVNTTTAQYDTGLTYNAEKMISRYYAYNVDRRSATLASFVSTVR